MDIWMGRVTVELLKLIFQSMNRHADANDAASQQNLTIIDYNITQGRQLQLRLCCDPRCRVSGLIFVPLT